MSKPFIVSIPHQLGKDEAVRRLKTGFGGVRTNYGHLFSVDDEVWTGDTLQFRVSAIGQAVSGTIDVAQDHVTLQVYLPWLLAKIAEAVQPLIRKEGTLLLENKK
jgi:Putative polyhydroxyalkanoic acid system protein (PHA_gran_rgn)